MLLTCTATGVHFRPLLTHVRGDLVMRYIINSVRQETENQYTLVDTELGTVIDSARTALNLPPTYLVVMQRMLNENPDDSYLDI